jgi:hypothetical protein
MVFYDIATNAIVRPNTSLDPSRPGMILDQDNPLEFYLGEGYSAENTTYYLANSALKPVPYCFDQAAVGTVTPRVPADNLIHAYSSNVPSYGVIIEIQNPIGVDMVDIATYLHCSAQSFWGGPNNWYKYWAPGTQDVSSLIPLRRNVFLMRVDAYHKGFRELLRWEGPAGTSVELASLNFVNDPSVWLGF